MSRKRQRSGLRRGTEMAEDAENWDDRRLRYDGIGGYADRLGCIFRNRQYALGFDIQLQ